MIKLEHVSKVYGNKTAVADVDLDIGAGELFAFLGPNGAGKTTTIKMMCGLLFPTSGRVLIVDEPTVGLDPHSVRQLKDLLRRQADLGTTVFLSSHSLDVVEELADRMAIINHGRLISCGTLEALRAQASVDGSLEKVFLTLTRPVEADGAFFGAEADA